MDWHLLEERSIGTHIAGAVRLMMPCCPPPSAQSDSINPTACQPKRGLCAGQSHFDESKKRSGMMWSFSVCVGWPHGQFNRSLVD